MCYMCVSGIPDTGVRVLLWLHLWCKLAIVVVCFFPTAFPRKLCVDFGGLDFFVGEVGWNGESVFIIYYFEDNGKSPPYSGNTKSQNQ